MPPLFAYSTVLAYQNLWFSALECSRIRRTVRIYQPCQWSCFFNFFHSIPIYFLWKIWPSKTKTTSDRGPGVFEIFVKITMLSPLLSQDPQRAITHKNKAQKYLKEMYVSVQISIWLNVQSIWHFLVEVWAFSWIRRSIHKLLTQVSFLSLLYLLSDALPVAEAPWFCSSPSLSNVHRKVIRKSRDYLRLARSFPSAGCNFCQSFTTAFNLHLRIKQDQTYATGNRAQTSLKILPL